MRKAIIIPIEEEVDFGLHAFLKRAVAEALAKKPDAIVFKVNTYGGELQSAFDIVDLLAIVIAYVLGALVASRSLENPGLGDPRVSEVRRATVIH